MLEYKSISTMLQHSCLRRKKYKNLTLVTLCHVALSLLVQMKFLITFCACDTWWVVFHHEMLCELSFLVSFKVTHSTAELVTFVTLFVMAKISRPGEHLVTTTDITLVLFSTVHTGMCAQPRSIFEHLFTSLYITLVLPFLVLVSEMGAHDVNGVE